MVKILGHRGYLSKYLQNSKTAFLKAFENGADGIECDLQKCKSDVFLVIHDDNAALVAGDDRKICDLTYNDVQSIVLNNGESILTLEELLLLIPQGKILNLELKTETITSRDCPVIYRILQKYIDRRYIIISSFSEQLLYYFKQEGVMVGWLLDEDKMKAGLGKIIKTACKLKPDYFNISIDLFRVFGTIRSYILLMLLKVLNQKIIFWCVNTVGEFIKIRNFVHYIITDDPEELKKSLV